MIKVYILDNIDINNINNINVSNNAIKFIAFSPVEYVKFLKMGIISISFGFIFCSQILGNIANVVRDI